MHPIDHPMRLVTTPGRRAEVGQLVLDLLELFSPDRPPPDAAPVQPDQRVVPVATHSAAVPIDNTADLAGIVKTLADRHVGLRSLTDTWLDTTTSQGVLMFHFFSAIAEYERNRLRERTMAGLAAAKARGRVGGRPTKMTPDKAATAHRMRAEKRTIRDIAKTIDVSEATVVRELARQRKSLQVPQE